MGQWTTRLQPATAFDDSNATRTILQCDKAYHRSVYINRRRKQQQAVLSMTRAGIRGGKWIRIIRPGKYTNIRILQVPST